MSSDKILQSIVLVSMNSISNQAQKFKGVQNHYNGGLFNKKTSKKDNIHIVSRKIKHRKGGDDEYITPSEFFSTLP